MFGEVWKISFSSTTTESRFCSRHSQNLGCVSLICWVEIRIHPSRSFSFLHPQRHMRGKKGLITGCHHSPLYGIRMLTAIDGLVSIWTNLLPNNQGKSFTLSSAFASFFSPANDLKWFKSWLVIKQRKLLMKKKKWSSIKWSCAVFCLFVIFLYVVNKEHIAKIWFRREQVAIKSGYRRA